MERAGDSFSGGSVSTWSEIWNMGEGEGSQKKYIYKGIA